MEIFKRLGIIPKNYELFNIAVTHPSYAHEKGLDRDYQLLEFLGDAVISKIIAEHLYRKGIRSEYELTTARAKMVQAKTLAKACHEAGLASEIRLGRGELASGVLSANIAADVFEAFCGALYLDQGEGRVKQLLLDTIVRYYDHNELDDVEDFKTRLQECLQAQHRHSINYKVDKDGIHDHDFRVSVWSNGVKYGAGAGGTRKAAERDAARDALTKLGAVKGG